MRGMGDPGCKVGLWGGGSSSGAGISPARRCVCLFGMLDDEVVAC